MESQSSTKPLLQYKKPDVSLTAKDGLFIATECHLALFPDEDGDTALHLAVVRHDIEACKKLLELFKIAGKSIDVYNKLLQTPLHVAIITNQRDIVQLLLTNKADAITPDRYGSTAYHLCAKYDHHECLVEILRNARERVTDLNMRNYEGVTALHIAVMNSSITTFKLLVANGADIDAKDNKGGRSPLIYAIEMNVRSIVEMLLECDAAVGQQTYSGDTALHIASGRGLQDIVRLLLRRGADVTMKNTHSETAISLATSPSVSDILRTRHGPSGSSPEMKTLTFVDNQYASHVARNLAVPIPPQYLHYVGNSPEKQAGVNQKRARKFKIENRFESDDVIPTKRIAHDPSLISPSRVPMESPIPISYYLETQKTISDKDKPFQPQGVTLKQEYIEANEQERQSVRKLSHFQHSFNPNISNESYGENDVKKEPESIEEVEIRGEEVEISSEEISPSKSDDEDNRVEISPVVEDQKQGVSYDSETPYTHKLMQYSTNLMNKTNATRTFTDIAAVKEEVNDNVTISENKPVIIMRQPQVDMATALYRPSYSPSSTYKAFTPTPSPKIFMLSQSQPSKSKSVPNSPQPPEANLYQLAREGLAVAAMATSNQNQPGREYGGITNYLKARPSRQAKIKAGTEELQHLALQGLAVAAMNNAKSETLQNQIRNKSTEENQITSTVTPAPEQLSTAFQPTKALHFQPPILHRSNSMPLKPYFDQLECGMDIQNPFEKSATAHFSSNNALLALAHANARKENVGQAVSAISMGRVQNSTGSTPAPKQPFITISPLTSEVSDYTKQNLRQAIMVKNSTAQPSKQLSKVFEVYDPKTHTFPSRLSIKIVPSDKKRTKLMTFPVTKGLSNSSNEQPRSKSPVPKKIPDLPPKTQQSNKVEIVKDNPRQTNPQMIKIHPSLQLVKTTREVAPTNTVAPLQMVASTGIPQSIRKSEQPTLISVAMAPIVASRVSSPAGSAKPTPNHAEPNKTNPVTSIVQPSQVSVAPVTSQSAPPTTTILSQVPLGLPGGQLLNPSLQNLGLMGHHAAGASYLQPQIAYAPYGKDFIPVLMQPYQTPFPQYTIPMQPPQMTTTTPAVQLNPAYLANVSKIPSPSIDPNLLPRMAMPVQDAQLRGLYPMTSPVYTSQMQQQIAVLQQEQYLKAIMQHQSLLAQNKPTIASVVLTSAAATKPVAAVTAVPVPRTSSSDDTKVYLSESEDQPLNLSKKATDQPLNLKKSSSVTSATVTASISVRSSVIRVNSSAPNEPPKTTTVGSDLGTAVTQIYQQATPITSVIPAVGDQRVHPSVILPPPLLIPGATTQGPQAALSSLSLPPIHYVNGMPFYLSLPPQL